MKLRRTPFQLVSQAGQTSVEYILLLLVVVILMSSVMGRLKEFVLGNAENCTPDSKSIICTFERLFDQTNFRYFTLKGYNP